MCGLVGGVQEDALGLVGVDPAGGLYGVVEAEQGGFTGVGNRYGRIAAAVAGIDEETGQQVGVFAGDDSVVIDALGEGVRRRSGQRVVVRGVARRGALRVVDEGNEGGLRRRYLTWKRLK